MHLSKGRKKIRSGINEDAMTDNSSNFDRRPPAIRDSDVNGMINNAYTVVNLSLGLQYNYRLCATSLIPKNQFNLSSPLEGRSDKICVS